MPLLSVTDADSEKARLAALQSYRIVDTPPEKEFDDLVLRATRECHATFAALALVDADRCWFKARVGLEATHAARHESFCGHVIRSSGLLVVPDARLDERFRSLAIVTVTGCNFYAGAPLISPDGHAIGTLCVLDRDPRLLGSAESAALRGLADQVITMLELRRGPSRPPFEPSAPAPAGAPTADARPRLLVVDDDDAVRAFVCLATRKLGYEVFEASNGAEALAQIEKQPDPIGLVLTDVNMPVMDGLELVRALRRQAVPPAITVMSGRFDPYVRSMLTNEGVASLLSKPFTRDELKAKLLLAKVPAR